MEVTTLGHIPGDREFMGFLVDIEWDIIGVSPMFSGMQ